MLVLLAVVLRVVATIPGVVSMMIDTSSVIYAVDGVDVVGIFVVGVVVFYIAGVVVAAVVVVVVVCDNAGVAVAGVGVMVGVVGVDIVV